MYTEYLDEIEKELERYAVHVTGYATEGERIILLEAAYLYKEIVKDARQETCNQEEEAKNEEGTTAQETLDAFIDELDKTYTKRHKDKDVSSTQKVKDAPAECTFDFSSIPVPEAETVGTQKKAIKPIWDEDLDFDTKVVKVLDGVFKGVLD